MNSYLTCRIGREWYGIHIKHVVEVLHLVALNDVPTENLVGVMTLRDQVVPVIDLRMMFKQSGYNYDLDTPIIAVKYDNKQLGLIVDEADDVIMLDESTFTPYDEDGIHAITRIDDTMLLILDMPFLMKKL